MHTLIENIFFFNSLGSTQILDNFTGLLKCKYTILNFQLKFSFSFSIELLIYLILCNALKIYNLEVGRRGNIPSQTSLLLGYETITTILLSYYELSFMLCLTIILHNIVSSQRIL